MKKIEKSLLSQRPSNKGIPNNALS